MNTYIMLLRGINVGGKNKLAMKDLIALLEVQGFENIKTYIQSGNVVFTTTKRLGKNSGDIVAQKVAKVFGFKPDIMILAKAEFAVAINNNPFAAANGKTIHFYFANDEAKANEAKLRRLAAANEQYKLIGKVFYLFAPDGIGRSKLVAKLEDCLGVAVTGRNLNTINKLWALAGL